MADELFSKVLVLDEDPAHADTIKQFCEAHKLAPLKVSKSRLMSVLSRNIDLGAILYAEDYGDTPAENASIALEIHRLRSELPIILRRERSATLDDLPAALREVFCAAYVPANIAMLGPVIDHYIFSLAYPNALVRGISEITESILGEQFRALEASWTTPAYIVRDRLIFGEVFSLIPLESNWCRGYMMLQAEEGTFLDLLGRHQPGDEAANFRAVNSLLGEITNLIWGAFKSRYIGDFGATASQVQVPLIVNRKHKYISFGTENPQLCFHYKLRAAADGRSADLYQRFIFNLNWSPEDFREIDRGVESLVESGELELF